MGVKMNKTEEDEEASVDRELKVITYQSLTIICICNMQRLK